MSRIVTHSKVVVSVLALGALTLTTQFAGALTAYAGAYLTLDSFSGHPGTTLSVTGGGWSVGDSVSFYVGSTSGTPIATTVVDANSNITAAVTIPANEPQGSLAIIGVDTTNNYQAQNSYYVVPLAPTTSDTAPSHAPYAVVSVSGTGYAPNEAIALELGGATASTTADSSGSFMGTITVPMTASGLYHLNATGVASGATSFDYFWIDAFYPNASPSAYYLMPGGTLAFTGSGFAAGETINVTESGSTTPVSTFTADPSGSFTTAGGFSVPAADHGKSATFTLTGTKSGGIASATITVGDFYAYASPSSYYLYPGQTETFSGGGFAAGETVDVFVAGSSTPATSFTTDTSGGFTNAGSVLVPFGSTKTVTFTLVGRTSLASGTASTGVGQYYPSLSPSSYYVTPNTDITISGSGFAPNEAVTLVVNGNTASSTSATTTAFGAFSAPVHIPFGAGPATVVGTGSLSSAQSSVSVALAKFYPNVSPSTWFVYPGSQVSFIGTGFVPGETVTTTFASASSTAVADQYGNVQTATSTVPYTATKSISASFIGSLSQSPTSVKVGVGTLSPYLTADTYSATQGGTAAVTGFSFAPGETVTVTAGSFSTTTVADASGTTAAVSIPLPFRAQTLPVTFTGNSSNVSGSMVVQLQGYYTYLTSSSYYAKPGTKITITGNGFAPNEKIDVGTDFGTTTVSASSMGVFSTDLLVPFANGASFQVTADPQTSDAISTIAIALAPYIPQVAPSTYYTLPGTTVTFVGTEYAPGEAVSVNFNGDYVETIFADSKGSFSYDYEIPFNATRATVSFVGNESGAGVADTLSLATYAAYISQTSYYGMGGSPITISGSGFAQNEQVALSFNGVPFATTAADKKGAITLATNIPYSTAGTMPLWAIGAKSGVKAGSSFTVAPVYPSFMLGSYAGAPGSSVQLVGSGFFPNETIHVTTDRTGSASVATFTTDASGSFSNSSYVLPSDFAEGTLVLSVEGEHSLTPESITYYVTGK